MQNAATCSAKVSVARIVPVGASKRSSRARPSVPRAGLSPDDVQRSAAAASTALAATAFILTNPLSASAFEAQVRAATTPVCVTTWVSNRIATREKMCDVLHRLRFT